MSKPPRSESFPEALPRPPQRSHVPTPEGEDLGRRKGQKVQAQGAQHPLAEPVFHTRDVANTILGLLEGKDSDGQSAEDDPILEMLAVLKAVAESQSRIELRLGAIEKALGVRPVLAAVPRS